MSSPAERPWRVQVHLSPEDVARLDYAASLAAQGPLGQGDPQLQRRLERWLQRRAPVRAHLDASALQSLLALAPLYGAYREHQRETVPLYHRAVTPPDEAAAALEVRLRAALQRVLNGAPRRWSRRSLGRTSRVLSLIRHLLTGHVYVRHDDGRMAGPLDPVQWSADGGTTPRADWVEQPYDLKDGAWSAGETFEYIVASGGQPS